ncbi:MAG: EamA family transporter [Ruminococcus sp.]|nr:EamA family transporter [Ruminococcus sp.]
MKQHGKRIFLLQLLMLLMSFGGVLSKKAASEKFLSFKWMALYGGMLLILMIYAVLWQQILKKMKLSTAYACKAVTVVWGMVWGVLFFNEQLTAKQLIGGALVVAGVILVASGKESHDTAD